MWAVVVMAVLNVLIVVLTIGVKTLRFFKRRSLRKHAGKLEGALDSSLASGEVHPRLQRLGSRDLDLLAALMIEYLSVLRGSDKDRIVLLANEIGRGTLLWEAEVRAALEEGPRRGEPRIFWRLPGRCSSH